MANNCRILTDEQKSSVNSIIGKYGEKLNNVEIENAYSIILNYIDNTKGTEEAERHIVTLDELEKFFIITRDLKLNYDNNKELKLVNKSNNDKIVFKETKDKAVNYHYLVLENNIDSNTFVFQDLHDTLVSKNIISPILYNDNRTGYMTKRGIVLDDNLNTVNSEEPILVYNNQSVNSQVKDRQIVYTPIGKTQQTYTIKKSEDGQYQIINKKGEEVFKKDNKDRRRIFANLAVQEGRAVVVEYKGKKYVVNNKDAIISVATGDKMNWSENNGDRKAIIELAKDKFNSMKSNPIQSNSQNISQDTFDYKENENNTQFNQLGTLDNSENFNNVQESEKILSSERTILSNKELKYWNEQGVGKMPRILVGSERTDPAFHVKEILDILKGKKKVNEWGIVNKKRTIVNQLSGKDFAGLYLITKHDGLPMLELLKTKIPKLIHFSITSLGGTKWEPGVMKYNDLLDRIKDYIKQGLDPNSVTIRIDPIVPGVTKKEDIENIVKRASEMGIKRIRFSVMDAYDNTQIAMKKLGYNFDDYYTKDNNGNYSFHANDSYINEICDFMLSLKDKYNITLGTCAEKIARKGISKEGCLSVGAINNMLGTSIEEKGTENNNQRKLCTCYGGKIDALQYNKNCASHCVYCYAKHENDKVLEYYNEDGTLKDNGYTRTRGILFDDNANNNTVIEDDPNVSDEDISNTNVNTSIIQTQIDQLFPPRILGYRVSNIARWFCDEVDKAYKKSISNLKEQVNSESASESLKAIDTLNNIDYGYIFKNIISPKTIFDNIYNQLKKESLMDESIYIEKNEEVYEPLKDTFDNEIAWENRVASIARDKQKQFSDIVNNKGVFEELCRRAVPLIELYTGYTINPDINTFKKIDFYEDIDEKNTKFDEENYNKENYMDMARQVSAYNKLSFKIKQFLSRIAKVDSDGYIEEDDWLNQVSLNADYAFSCLVDLLSDMVDSSDVMSRLKEFVKYPSNSWAEPIIEKLEEDPSFITDFYVCFNNTFTNYWIQKEKTEGDKEFTMFLHLNRPMGVSYWINTWRNDFNNGTVYDKDGIWNKDKYANVEKVHWDDDGGYDATLKSDKYKTIIEDLEGTLKTINHKIESEYKDEIEERPKVFYEYLEDPEKGGKDIIPKLSKLLNIVGINLPENTILAMCTSDKENIDFLIGNIKNIIKYAKERLLHSIKTYKGEEVFPVIDPFNKFKEEYLNIAEMIGTIPEGAVEQTFKAGENKYYSYHNHNYISSLIAKINDTNDERRSNFIREEFMKSSWFFNKKTNEFTNPFFEYLFNIESLENIKVTNRYNRALDYKVLLLANDKAYEDWNSVESMKVLYNEYISEQSRSTMRTTYEDAYFPIPVISDVKSAEFMHLPLLDVFANPGINKEKNNLFSNRIIQDYELGGLNFFEAVVMQEYNRIMLVRERYNKLCRQKANNEKVTVFQIANWDTTNGKNGGAEFKFLPRLNKLIFDGNKTFIEKIDELKKAGNNDALRYFIRGTIYDVLNKDFCDSFAIWNKEGGFLASDGKYCINIKEASHGDRIGSYEYYKKDNTESVINQLKAIKNYLNNVNIDSRSNVWKYSYFTDADDVIKTVDTLLEDKKMKNGSDYYEEFNNLQKIDRFLYNLHKFHGVQYIKEGNISINTENGIENFLVEEMRKYYWNHAYSQAAIIQLLVTDLAFFKDMEDFQKRFKQVYSTVTKLDIKAKFNGDKAGREIERTMKLADNTVISSVIDEIVSIITTMHKNGTISDYDAAYILSKYGYSNHNVGNTKYVKFGKVMFKSEKVNVADAQAYRSLDSYRSIMIMSKKWTDEMERSYNNLVNGTWSLSDFTILAQTLKPFMYATVNKVVGYEKTNVPIIDSTTGKQLTDKEGNPLYDTIEDRSKPIYARVGIQHKNSEFTLLPIYGAIAGVLSKSTKMKAINRFMKDNDIDLIQFESAVKVGKQGVVDLNSVDRYREDNNLKDEQYEDKIYQFLEDASKDGGQLNPDVVDEIPFDRYGISTATPEHFIKKEDGGGKSIVGTQIRKLIMADMPDDAVITIHGKQYNKEEILRLYDELNVENLLNSFKDVNDIFTNPERLSEKLRDMSIGNSKYGVNLSEGFTIDENGEFAVPLCDPIGDNKIQELCTSIFKNIISKQKIKGGSLIQVSNYGYSDDLKIVFKNKDGEVLDYNVYKKKHRGATKEEYDKFAKQALDNGELSIAYFECYMPIPDMEMLAPLIDPVTGYIDINKKEGDSYIFPEELRKCIGYRIPTEAKYSMAPLYIKGFLPIQSGGAIMLPSEITTIAGSDFDVDKIYVMLYEYWVERFNMNRAKQGYNDYLAKMKGVENALVELAAPKGNEFANAILDTSKSEQIIQTFDEWFKRNKETYRYQTPSFHKVKYDNSKSPIENSLKQRNNMIIDIMFSILTSEYAAEQILNPGGFDYPKWVSRIATILSSASKKDIINSIARYDKEIAYNRSSILTKLTELDRDKLEKIFKELKPVLNPLSPATWIDIQQRNMMGKELIGIYAVQDTSHAIMQNAKIKDKDGNIQQLRIKDSDEFRFKINGKTYNSLHDIKNPEGKYVTRSLAQLLSASVDNAKDPVLAYLNQNKFTADITSTLLRAGYDIFEVGLLMTQPIVRRMVEIYNSNELITTDKQKIAQAALEEIYAKLGGSNNVKFNPNFDYTNEYLSESLLLYTAFNSGTLNADERVKIGKEILNRQVQIALLIDRVAMISKDLSTVVHGTQFDTARNVAGPKLVDVYKQVDKAKRLISGSMSKEFSLSNAELIRSGIIKSDNNSNNIDSIDNVRKKLLDSPIPLVQAFYTLGIEGAMVLLGNYFPQMRNDFIKVKDSIEALSVNGKLSTDNINSIFKEMFIYVFSGTEFFGNETIKDADGNEHIVTARMKRDYFIRRFPKDFVKLREENKDIAEFEFIQTLTTEETKNPNMPEILTLQTVGSLRNTTREQYINDWKALLYVDNPIASKLALNLMRYNFYRNGFAFGPKTFMNLAPTLLKKVAPDYISTLRKMSTDGAISYDKFIDQYILHHLNDGLFTSNVFDYDESVFCKSHIDGNILEIDEYYDTVTFRLNTVSEESSLIKKFQNVGNNMFFPVPHDYISKNVYGTTLYYKLSKQEVEQNGDFVLEYKRVKPLGNKYAYYEYEYGKDAELINSINGAVLKSNEPNDSNSNDYTYDNDVVDVDTMNIIQGVTLTDEQIERSKNAWEQIMGNTNSATTNITTSNATSGYTHTLETSQPQTNTLGEAQLNQISFIQNLINSSQLYQKQDNRSNLKDYDSNDDFKDGNNLPTCK